MNASNKFSFKQQQNPSQQQQPQFNSKSTAKSTVLNSNSNNNNNNSNAVKFIDFHPTEKIDDREKYLTAKYPNHQMALIKKRLKVEFWIDDRLKYLYNIDSNDTTDDYQICPDDLVDNLLDIDNENERKFFILDQLKNAKKSKDQVMQFADELLVKLRML